jgi:hypothetical protein
MNVSEDDSKAGSAYPSYPSYLSYPSYPSQSILSASVPTVTAYACEQLYAISAW